MLFTVLITFLILDSIYLTLTKNYYNNLVTKIQKSPLELKIMPAAGAYSIILFSWYYFVFQNIKNQSKKKSIIDSAVLGFCMYSLFDFTNMAIFKNWDIKTVIIDSIWGSILYTLTTIIYLISI
jgi:uncharacterized membrane protein